MILPLNISREVNLPDHTGSSGVSPESEEVAYRLNEFRQDKDKSVSFSWRDSLSNEILDIFDECSEDNWDGYGAAAVLNESKSSALRFITTIPDNFFIKPEVNATPSGHIGFQWKTDTDILTITFRKYRIIYAYISSNEDNVCAEITFVNYCPDIIYELLGKKFIAD